MSPPKSPLSSLLISIITFLNTSKIVLVMGSYATVHVKNKTQQPELAMIVTPLQCYSILSF